MTTITGFREEAALAHLLRNILKFVQSHDVKDARIEGDKVVFGIEWVQGEPMDGYEPAHPVGSRGVQLVMVTTMEEARDALGY